MSDGPSKELKEHSVCGNGDPHEMDSDVGQKIQLVHGLNVNPRDLILQSLL